MLIRLSPIATIPGHVGPGSRGASAWAMAGIGHSFENWLVMAGAFRINRSEQQERLQCAEPKSAHLESHSPARLPVFGRSPQIEGYRYRSYDRRLNTNIPRPSSRPRSLTRRGVGRCSRSPSSPHNANRDFPKRAVPTHRPFWRLRRRLLSSPVEMRHERRASRRSSAASHRTRLAGSAPTHLRL